MELKPQDTLLALKYWSIAVDQTTMTVRELADQVGISASEVSKGTQRLFLSHLLVQRDGRTFTENGALLEWLSYGVRYAYPQQSVGYGRGLPTAWNCSLVQSDMSPPSPAWVWQQAGGSEEGILVQPFHAAVPHAAASDKRLYQALSLLEAIRGGKPRELAIARRLLTQLIKDENAK